LTAGLEDKPAHREAMRELNGKWEWRKNPTSFHRLGFFFASCTWAGELTELVREFRVPFGDLQYFSGIVSIFSQ
jgi:hypothetical protein